MQDSLSAVGVVTVAQSDHIQFNRSLQGLQCQYAIPIPLNQEKAMGADKNPIQHAGESMMSRSVQTGLSGLGKKLENLTYRALYM